ncbi:hypothetical protein BJX76DRAFT_342141 [Aspergillus varians]
MGQKISVVNGVKSENYTQPGNAVNEIWVGNTEIISRLPFGDSDMEQAGWPKKGMPKIPWHNFIIPMKRALSTSAPSTTYNPSFRLGVIPQVPSDRMVCCSQDGCISDPQITNTVITAQLVSKDSSHLFNAFLLSYLACCVLCMPQVLRRMGFMKYDPTIIYNKRVVLRFALLMGVLTMLYTIGTVFAWLAMSASSQAYQVYQINSSDWKVLDGVARWFVLYHTVASTWATGMLWSNWWKIRRDSARPDEEILIEFSEGKPKYCPQRQLRASV